MTIDEQLREFARRADRVQPVITAQEVVRRASAHGTRPFTPDSRFDHNNHAVVGQRPVQFSEEDHNMIELETPPQSDERRKNPRRIVVAALAAAAAVIAIVLFAVRGNESPSPADQTAPTVPATGAPLTATQTTGPPAMSDLEVIEAGVAAFYSGDADRAAELFELEDRTDEEIRAESAYQAAIGGRVDISCTENLPGSFNCVTPYNNALTDAIRQGGGRDVWPVVVEDGVITKFGFTEHTTMLLEMGIFLASEDRFDGFEKCINAPFVESCATIEMENLDAWASWHRTFEPADVVEAVVTAWYRGDCEAAVLLSWGTPDCTPSSASARTVAYESILGAQVSIENCESTPRGEDVRLACEVRYSNAMNDAVGEPPSVTSKEFLLMHGIMAAGPDEQPWYEVDDAEGTDLRDSFRLFAEGGELAGEYAGADCATVRTPECANLIVDNLDAWAAWYRTNG